MSGFRRLMVAFAAAWAAVPLAAQVAPANNSSDTIGPRELRDFSIGSTPAPPAPPPEAAAPVVTAPAPQASAPPRARPRAATPPPAFVPVQPPAAEAPSAPLPPSLPDPSVGPVDVAPPPAEAAPAPVPAEAPQQGWLPWLLAGLALAVAGGLLLFKRSRARTESYFEEPQDEPEPGRVFAGADDRPPEPAPPPVAPPPPAVSAGTISIKRPDAFAPVPPAPEAPAGTISVKRPTAFPPPPPAPEPAPAGIVSSRLRPWLELAFQPSSAVVDEAQASVRFDVIVTNSGNAPAREVLVEALMINAGPDQDVELQRFFDAPVGAGEPIEAIPPLGSISLTSAVSLPLDQVQAYEVDGRKLFVPVVAFNALYRWGSGQGQSSASFILGRGSEAGAGGRMAPLRLDLGPRQFADLAARPHSLGVQR